MVVSTRKDTNLGFLRFKADWLVCNVFRKAAGSVLYRPAEKGPCASLEFRPGCRPVLKRRSEEAVCEEFFRRGPWRQKWGSVCAISSETYRAGRASRGFVPYELSLFAMRGDTPPHSRADIPAPGAVGEPAQLRGRQSAVPRNDGDPLVCLCGRGVLRKYRPPRPSLVLGAEPARCVYRPMKKRTSAFSETSDGQTRVPKRARLQPVMQ